MDRAGGTTADLAHGTNPRSRDWVLAQMERARRPGRDPRPLCDGLHAQHRSGAGRPGSAAPDRRGGGRAGQASRPRSRSRTRRQGLRGRTRCAGRPGAALDHARSRQAPLCAHDCGPAQPDRRVRDVARILDDSFRQCPTGPRQRLDHYHRAACRQGSARRKERSRCRLERMRRDPPRQRSGNACGS